MAHFVAHQPAIGQIGTAGIVKLIAKPAAHQVGENFSPATRCDFCRNENLARYCLIVAAASRYGKGRLRQFGKQQIHTFYVIKAKRPINDRQKGSTVGETVQCNLFITVQVTFDVCKGSEFLCFCR